MSLAAVNSLRNIYQAGLPENSRQVGTDFKILTDAVEAGDMTAAQQAFAILQEDDPQIAKALAQSGPNAGNPQVGALQSLATALQSGDAPTVRTALASLQRTLKAHRGYHLRAEPAPPAPSSTAANGATAGADSDGDNDNYGSGATRATRLNAIA